MSDLMARFLILMVALGPGLSEAFGVGRALNFLVLVVGIILSPRIVAIFFRRRRFSKALDREEKARIFKYKFATWLGAAYFILLFVAGVRGLAAENAVVAVQSWAFIFWYVLSLGAIATAAVVASDKPHKILDWIVQTLIFVNAANIFLWTLGIENPNAAENFAANADASLLSLIGFHIKRVDLPLTGGVNTAGVVSGIILTYGIASITEFRKKPIGASTADFVFLIVLPLISLLLTDSRGALVFAVVASQLSRMNPKTNLSLVGGAILIVILFAISIDKFSEGMLSTGLIRSGSDDSVLTGRTLIWASAISSLATLQLASFIGFGAYGQAVSGVATQYSALFEGWGDNPELFSVHNGILQTSLDLGLIGVAVLIILLIAEYVAIGADRATAIGARRRSLCVLNFLVLQSFTEVTLTPYLSLPFMAFAALVFMSWRIR